MERLAPHADRTIRRLVEHVEVFAGEPDRAIGLAGELSLAFCATEDMVFYRRLIGRSRESQNLTQTEIQSNATVL